MPLTEQRRAELEKLVQTKKVVLFMKGNRHFPACGFSATVIGILNQLTREYDTVNILENPAVREGMKEFSSWPTFPQLYVDGRFIGGCDIVKEMHAEGELQKVIGVTATKATTDLQISISPPAAAAFKEALSGAGDEVLRLDVDAQFHCDLHVGPKEEGDLAVSSGGVVLHVAGASASRANGIRIDYGQGPGGNAFKIENPNAPPRVRPIDAKALKALLDAGKVELFDVRPDDERALASIPQAKRLDAAGQERLLGMEKSTPVAFHCHHGTRSRNAAEALLREGFTNVYNLEGGIDAWSRDVDPAIPHY